MVLDITIFKKYALKKHLCCSNRNYRYKLNRQSNTKINQEKKLETSRNCRRGSCVNTETKEKKGKMFDLCH